MKKKKRLRSGRNRSSRSSFYYNLNKVLVFLIFLLSILTILVNQKPADKPQVLSQHTVIAKVVPTATKYTPTPIKSIPAPPKSGPTAKIEQPIVKVPQAQAATVDTFCLTVPVLLYHHIQPMERAYENGNQSLTVSPEFFDSQMSYLAQKGYRTIPAHELVQALLEKRQLPEKSIIITLDDAYDDAFIYAYPIFQKYNVIGNIMVPTGLIGGAKYLTWEQLREMTGGGFVYSYNHTWSHASLPNLPAEQIEQEVLTAQKELASQLGKNYPLITYPYGTYDENVFAILKKHGFQAGFSTMHGINQCDNNLMHLYRIHIGNANLSYYGL